MPRLWPYFQAGIEPSLLAATLVASGSRTGRRTTRRRRPPSRPRSPTRGPSAARATPPWSRTARSCFSASWVNPVPRRLRNSRSRAVATRAVVLPAVPVPPLPVPGAGVGAWGWVAGLGAGWGGGLGLRVFGAGCFFAWWRFFFFLRFLRADTLKMAIGIPARRGWSVRSSVASDQRRCGRNGRNSPKMDENDVRRCARSLGRRRSGPRRRSCAHPRGVRRAGRRTA